MAAINDLISQIQDETLRNRIQEEVSKMAKQKKFGLVFEEHMPESTPLYDMPIKRGCNVMLRDSKDDKAIYVVLKVEGNTAVCVKPKQKDEAVTFELKDIVRVAEFGESMHLVLALTYVIGFAVFYIGNSLFTNSNRIEGWAEWKVLLVSCIGNILGISIIIAFQYITFASTGHLPLNAIRVINLFPLVVLIPIATIIGRKFYDKTGNIYLGGIVMGIFYTFVTVANTRTDGFWLM